MFGVRLGGVFPSSSGEFVLEINRHRADIGLGLLEAERWDKKVVVKYFKV